MQATQTETYKSPEDQLAAAVARFTNTSGIKAATMSTIAAQFVSLFSSHWEQICEVARLDESEGQVAVGTRTKFDLTGKTPIVKTKMSFTQRTSDDAEGIVPDPDQKTLFTA